MTSADVALEIESFRCVMTFKWRLTGVNLRMHACIITSEVNLHAYLRKIYKSMAIFTRVTFAKRNATRNDFLNSLSSH